MTKQEEIREGIEKVICSCCDDVEDWEAGQTLTEAQEHCHKRAICAYCTGLRDALLEYENSQGMVLQVERKLPFPMCTVRMNDPRYQDGAMIHAQKLMLEAGFRAVAPIKE